MTFVQKLITSIVPRTWGDRHGGGVAGGDGTLQRLRYRAVGLGSGRDSLEAWWKTGPVAPLPHLQACDLAPTH
jgi:hypothetical protein